MARIIAIVNQKGGVGKTTTTVNITASLKALGKRVLLCDFDPQANATSGMGVDKNTASPNVYDVLINGADPKKSVVSTKYGDVIPSNKALAGAGIEMIAIPDREHLLKKALDKFIQEIEKAQKQMQQPKTYRGKQSIKHLMSQNAAISNIEVTDGNIKSFERTASKYGLDFALKKDVSVEPPSYLVFFKGRDVDVMTAAFKEFSAKTVKQKEQPSIRHKLDQEKAQSKAQHKEKVKVKTKDRGVEL